MAIWRVVSYSGGMAAGRLTREDVIQRAKSAEAQIASLGVRRLALFGSVLRDQAIGHVIRPYPGCSTIWVRETC